MAAAGSSSIIGSGSAGAGAAGTSGSSAFAESFGASAVVCCTASLAG